MPLPEDVMGPPSPNRPVVSEEARQQAVERIQTFIDNIHAGTLGTLGTIFLIFIAIRLLMTIEQTFNDIWGIQRGRSIWRKVVYYWTTITLGPLLLLGALAMTGTVEFSSLFGKLQFAPSLEKVLLQAIPFVVLWFGFSLMYGLMPNTHVQIRAAIVGGIVGGTLWQLNSLLSTLYLSRVVTYSKIYGALGIIPVFLVGLYFSWLIVLLGAQVSFAAQNVRVYLQRRASEHVDQEGRELIACRAVLLVAHHFVGGLKPPTAAEMAVKLGAPLHLLNQIVHRLVEGRVLSEVVDEGGGLLPARPLESLRVADVLHVVRSHDSSVEKPSSTGDGELMAKLLGDLNTAARTAPANMRFSELAEKLQKS
jgi:membrane protein